jgi:hypothetical protein
MSRRRDVVDDKIQKTFQFNGMNGMNGIEWNRMESNGIEWIRMESNGMNGIEWNKKC